MKRNTAYFCFMMTSYTHGFLFLRSPSRVLSWSSHGRDRFQKSHWWPSSSSIYSKTLPQKHHSIILSNSFTFASNQPSLSIDKTTTISQISDIATTTDIMEPQQSTAAKNYLNDDDCLPLFVHNVSSWLDTLNISYDLCSLPLSSVIPYNATQSPLESQITLYIVRLIINRATTMNTAVEADHAANRHPLPPPLVHPSQQQEAATILLLHLLPSPTSLQTCVPAGVKQYMTDHPQIVVRSLQNVTDNTENLNSATEKTTTETNDSNVHKNIQMIHLHEDTWNHNRTKPIVQSRLLYRLGIGATVAEHRRIYARQTIAKRIDSITARNFLLQHHLWGATYSKYSYGLYDKTTKNNMNNDSGTENERLVAVATFSSRRNVRRGQGHEQRIYRSYELIRTCSSSDTSIVGGISKLLSAFIKDNSTPDKPVDDIVTVIDRDWGIGQSNWHTLGFKTVATMLPIPMVISRKDGTRRHLIGAGIHSEDDPNMDVQKLETQLIRFGLPTNVLSELNAVTSYNEAIQCLHRHGYYLVFDAGVERLFLLVSKRPAVVNNESVQSIWNTSIPQYAIHHYSTISGIDAIIKHVKQSII